MDKLTPDRRSANMRAIRSTDTKPELLVRKALRAVGFTGYRLHRRDLPGRPDIAFIGRKKAIFVHGCFWHGHDCKEGSRRPVSRQGYWLPKIVRNQARDESNQRVLISKGWDILILWECQLNKSDLQTELREFLDPAAPCAVT
ncbi:very short patch repair endonuclease [Labrys miyagiensis]